MLMVLAARKRKVHGINLPMIGLIVFVGITCSAVFFALLAAPDAEAPPEFAQDPMVATEPAIQYQAGVTDDVHGRRGPDYSHAENRGDKHGREHKPKAASGVNPGKFEPAWFGLTESFSAGDSRELVFDGPRQTKRECCEQIKTAIFDKVKRYAHAKGYHALRSHLLPHEIADQVVVDQRFTTSQHDFNGETQTWYTLHQLIEIDDEVDLQLVELNNRAIVDERLTILAAISAGVFGVLGLGFIVLRSLEKKPNKA